MNKPTIIYSYHRILLSYKKNILTQHRWMSKALQYTSHIYDSDDSVYMTSGKSKNRLLEAECRRVDLKRQHEGISGVMELF